MIGERLWTIYLREPVLTLLVAGNVVFGVGAMGLALTALLLRLANDRKARRWTRLERLWEQPTLAVVTAGAAPETLWALVGQRDRLYFLSYLLRYARRLVGAERRIIDDLAQPYLDLLLPDLRRRQAERRARAVQTLSTFGQRRYAPAVERALDDPSPLVAMVAARALARRESPDFAAAILSRLHRFGQWRPSFLASMLASVGPALAPALRQAFTNTEYPARARGVAAEALRQLNDYPAADLAAQVLGETRDRDLLASTLGLLAHLGRTAHLPAIRVHVDSSEAIVRARAVAALGYIGAAEDLPIIVRAFDDPSPWVALRAGEALRDTRATAALAGFAESGHPRAELARQLLTGRSA